MMAPVVVLTNVLPLAGPDTTATVAGSRVPSGSLSLASTGTTTAVPCTVVASSPLAVGSNTEVIVRLQPLAIDPISTAASSTTYKRQVPLGFTPLNTDNVEMRGPTGAGAGNGSSTV